jgi:hypothetical protein
VGSAARTSPVSLARCSVFSAERNWRRNHGEQGEALRDLPVELSETNPGQPLLDEMQALRDRLATLERVAEAARKLPTLDILTPEHKELIEALAAVKEEVNRGR